MKTDRDRLNALLDEFGVEYFCYNEDNCLHEEAIAWGATNSVSIRGTVDFIFNGAGEFIGTSTANAKSFKRHPDTQKITDILNLKPQKRKKKIS